MFQYDPKTSKRVGKAEHILDPPGGGYHQHWTRTIAFSPDGNKLYTAVGSQTNVSGSYPISAVLPSSSATLTGRMRESSRAGCGSRRHRIQSAIARSWGDCELNRMNSETISPGLFHARAGRRLLWLAYSYIGKDTLTIASNRSVRILFPRR